jgi:hypothetical protein
LRIVSPDGKENRAISQRVWETYGWSKDGADILGIWYADNRRLLLGKVEIASGRETQIADLGAIPAAFYFAEDQSQLPYRGFSLHANGGSFLTAIFRAKAQIYLMKDFDRTVRLAERWWRRAFLDTPRHSPAVERRHRLGFVELEAATGRPDRSQHSRAGTPTISATRFNRSHTRPDACRSARRHDTPRREWCIPVDFDMGQADRAHRDLGSDVTY